MKNNLNLEREIQAITDEIQQLTIEFDRRAKGLQQRLTRLQSFLRTEDTDTINHFSLGDTVEIINNYRGRKGTIGIITKLTSKRVTFRDKNNQSHTRSYANVRKVE